MRLLSKRERPGVIEPDPFAVSDGSSIRRARLLGQLGLEYQPIVDLSTGHLAGIEALLRWHVPGADTLAAANFVELLDSEGTLSATDRETLRLAAVFLTRGWTGSEQRVPISVNVPARNLLRAQSAVTILALLDRVGLPAHLLELDLVDLDDDLAVALEQGGAIRQLHDAGVAVALDGVDGVSEPAVVLAALPIDAVKIAVQPEAPEGEQPAPDETLLVRQAQRLGLRLVAKRTETAAQLSAARKLGFDHAQGYLLGKPQPAEGFAAADADPAPPLRAEPMELGWAA